MSRVLVVANQTLGGSDLLQAVRDRMTQGPCEFTLLVPATAHAHRESAMDSLNRRLAGAPLPQDVSGADEADYDHARSQLETGIEHLQRLGAEVDGNVGDPNPMKAIEDALSRRKYDEIILSTLPSGISRWLGQDLPHKVIRRFKGPVTVVTASRSH
jgi:nucleotide-binding universal stress UspA family protein